MAVNLNNPIQRLGTSPPGITGGGAAPSPGLPARDDSRSIMLEGAAMGQAATSILSAIGESKRESAVGEFSDEMRSHIEDFAQQPDRLNIIRQTEQDLELARASMDAQSGPPEQARVGAMTRDLKRLKTAFNRGAISSTELAMRRNAMLRQAIAERPHLAEEYKRAAASEFGLHTPELDVIDDQLESMTTAPEPSDFQMRFFESIQDLGFKYGVAIPTVESAAQWGEKLMILEGRAQTLARNADISEDVRTINANQARGMLPDTVAATFLRTRGQVQQIIDAPQSEMSDEEKLAAIRTLKAGTRQSLYTQYGEWLGTEALDAQIDPAMEILDFAEGVVQGTFRRDRLDNQYNALLTQGATAAAMGDPDVLSLASMQKLLGSTDLSQLGLQQAGYQSTLDGITNNVARAMQGDAQFNSEELKAYSRGEGLQQLMQGIANHAEVNVPPDEAAEAATNLIRAMLPERATVGIEGMKRFKSALPVLASPDAKTMVESLNLDQGEMERLNERVNNYLASVVVPNLRESLEEETTRIGTRRDTALLPTGPGSQGRTRVPRTVAANVKLMDVVIPVWGNDGSISFELDATKVPEDFQEDSNAQRNLREGVRKLNSIYAKEWNNITGTSANLNPGSNRKQISEQAWKLYMGFDDDGEEQAGE